MKRSFCYLLSLVLFTSLVFAQPSAHCASFEGGGSRLNQFTVLHRDEGQKIPLASSEKDYAEFYSIWKTGDRDKMKAALEDGLVFTVAPNTSVKVINFGSVESGSTQLDLVRVQILNGSLSGEVAWTELKYLPQDLIAKVDQPDRCSEAASCSE